MPTRIRSSWIRFECASTVTPSIVIDPSSYVSKPLIQRSTVDLPEPDGPIRHTTSPCCTSRLTPFSTACC